MRAENVGRRSNPSIEYNFTNRQYSGKSGNKCSPKMAAVDVEDLAMFFGENRRSNVKRSSSGAEHRVFRNRNVNAAALINSSVPNGNQEFHNSSDRENTNWECQYAGECYQQCPETVDSSINPIVENRNWKIGDYEKSVENSHFRSHENLENFPLAIGPPCTEEQWLACPALNCPIYDCLGNIVIGTDQLPVSANENGWKENVSYIGPVPPPCIVNDHLDPRFFHDSAYPTCYLQSEEEQQIFDDYLSNEKRKEKSRDAARSRRSRETNIFTELASVLPLSNEQAAHLDKASVMRLAIAYLKVRSVIDSLEKPVTKCLSLPEMDTLIPKALDGFMLVLSSNGDMVYLSENVSDYLGVSQMEMMGQSVYEYSHPCDHEELRECLSMKSSDVKDKRPCDFFIRLKCTLTNKGRKVNLKSASYKVIHCTGRAMGICGQNVVKIDNENANSRDYESSESSSKEDDETDSGSFSTFACAGGSLVVVGSPIPHPSNIEVPLGHHTFLSKHSLNMKFTYADETLAEYLGWASHELLGKSVFEFHHALDNSTLDKSFKSLFIKGQCETMAYRFLNKNGGYAWVLTQATLIHCSKQHKPLSVVCVNHILSGVECEDEVYSERQLEARKTGVTLSSPVNSSSEDYEKEESTNLPSLPSLILENPSLANSEDSYGTSDNFSEENDRETGDERINPRISGIEDFEKKILIPDSKAPINDINRPLSVTASIFGSSPDFECPDPRKDLSNLSLANKGTRNPEIRRERANWCFQDKPILEYDPPRNNRAQSVTRNVFVPAGLIQDQELPQQLEQTTACRPQTTTASIFAPRTEDMNKGFLTFSEDQPGLTMLKDEPEDLTHLAPTPGDVCVPLEDTPFLSDMLDEFILGTDDYCPLLSPEDLPTELPNSELNESLTKESGDMCGSIESSLADSDPFIYRDIPSPCSLSPDLLSPAGFGKSPDQSSLGSLQSPNRNDLVDGMMSIGSCSPVGNPITEDEMLMLSINDVIGDEELALRAPYIPMSDQDEALQLLISDDTVMWGPTQPPDRKSKWHHEEEKSLFKRQEDSNLARLLKIDTGPAKYNDHGGGLVEPAQIFGQIGEKGNNPSRFERPSKRVHAPISQSLSSENKRGRFNDSRLPIDHSLIRDATNVLETTLRTGNGLNYEEQSIDLCGILDDGEKNTSFQHQQQQQQQEQHVGSRLLLQQLMGRDNAKSSMQPKVPETTKKDVCDFLKIVTREGSNMTAPRTENKEKIGFAGDGGGSETNTTNNRAKRQTNSVLMNLLVSGCDVSAGYVCLAKPKTISKNSITTK